MYSGNSLTEDLSDDLKIYIRVKKGIATDEEKLRLEMWYDMVCLGKENQIRQYEDYIHKHPEVLK